MPGDVDIAAVAEVLADRSRSRMLLALDDGRALPASRLAAEAGVRQALISALETAAANPKLETLIAVAAALGVEVAALLAAPTTGLRTERPTRGGQHRAGRGRR